MHIEELNRICKETFIDHLDIRFLAFKDNHITAEIRISPYHLQPAGVVHGGVYISLAETIAGAASSMLVMEEGKLAYGVTVNSQHLASVTNGKITAEGKLIYRGSTKHIWDVEITDEKGKLISLSRVTNSVKEIDPNENKNSEQK